MRTSIQLRIPTRCPEQWNHMSPAKDGRHCESCRKTVVDFTGMSDREIARYLAQAGPDVCGRLLPEQLNRPLQTETPVRRTVWAGWSLLFSGLLMASDRRVVHKAAGPPVHKEVPASGLSEDATTGMMLVEVDKIECHGSADTDILEPVADSTQMGALVPENLPVPVIVAKDPDSSLIPPVVSSEEEEVIETGVSVNGMLLVPPPVETPDTLGNVKKWIRDTLQAVHLMPQLTSPLKVYPNPVRRGAAFFIDWPPETGNYLVSVCNISGALIQQKMVYVGSLSQKDAFTLPAELATGVYVVRAVREGKEVGFTQKILVE